jgi:hypothetical protein
VNFRMLAAPIAVAGLLTVACGSQTVKPEEVRAGLRSDFEQRQAASKAAEASNLRTIATTLGVGVRRRDHCTENAPFDGSWPEGARVEFIRSGTGECEGWSWVAGSGASGWVRSEFLGSDR